MVLGDSDVLRRFTTYEEIWLFCFVSVTTSSLVAQLAARAYLALILDSINLEDLLNRMDEDIASEILAAIAARIPMFLYRV